MYILEPTPCSPETPDDGWVTIETALTDHCYRKFDEDKTWQAANDDCASKNGSLASIHSENENMFITSTLSHQGWIGLLKVHEGGQRHWSDGSAYDYTKWKGGGT